MAERTAAYPADLGGADVPAAEAGVRAFWEDQRVFPRSERDRADRPPFVFYEGPPTANGKPGVHHAISRVVKDIFCRYKTMTGHYVLRKGGWDTHGLPVEIEVEKQLGLASKEDVEAYGIEAFNAKCRESVFQYKKEWDEFTQRIGFWLDLDDPYVTFQDEYIESVWWLLKQLWDKDLLYKGYKVVPYCTRCETALSSHEVAQGYQDVDDPSVTVRMRATDTDEVFLVWTTTPWTLPSNVALAVGEDIDYARVRHEGQIHILAASRVAAYFGDDAEVEGTVKGSELVGRTYQQLIPELEPDKPAFRIIPADFVSTEDGTGIVHMAPAYGEDDNRAAQLHDLPTLHPLDKAGRFTEDLKPYAGLHAKEADKVIIKDLKSDGRLFKQEQIRHSYPHCWRCKTPLLYYARDSWYVRTTQLKDQLLASNEDVNWVPTGAGQERFGDWLRNNVDWALSRDRFWGTPLPIWVCADCDHKVCIGSRQEIADHGGAVPDDLHRPFVDEVTFACDCGGTLRRSPEVIDVWFDSGAMPYAQWHYPFENKERFQSQFPADFISEGMDQTRGWFYSLLAIATMIDGRSSYRNVVALGLLLDKHGQKMSKTKGNAVDPVAILRDDGADPLRWYLTTVSPAWQPTRFDPEGVKEVKRRVMATLENVYAFFALYANLDGVQARQIVEVQDLEDQLDRWLLSRYHAVVAEVRGSLDRWDATAAARQLGTFILDELSNWYVRRSRRRFWKGESGPAKQQAYDTLYTVLEGISRMLAPFAPFLADRLYRALHAHDADAASTSVHLADFPELHDEARDEELERSMATVLELVSLGRSLRQHHEIRTRQPLRGGLVYSRHPHVHGVVDADGYAELVTDELNLKQLDWIDDPAQVAKVSAKANFRALGKRFGKDTPRVAKLVAALDADALGRLRSEGSLELTLDDQAIQIELDEVFIQEEGLQGYVSESTRELMLALNVELDDALRQEGLAREIINRVQNLRKDSGLEVSDRIRLFLDGNDAVRDAVQSHRDRIQAETLAKELLTEAPDDGGQQFDVDGHQVTLALTRA